MKYINVNNTLSALANFRNAVPFDHCIIDGFFEQEIAERLEQEFLDYEDPKWFHYKNPIEDKKALNDWNLFPALTYRVFQELISESFVKLISNSVGSLLYQDPGLHGGGWHIHGTGGNLNPHFDYSIHPKAKLQRKLNIIIYVSSDLKEDHGGHLGFWSHDGENNSPLSLEKVIQPIFNRAVIFDTTQNSWHGMCRPLVQPQGIYRKSLAVYYLTEPPLTVDTRERALFAPRDDQKGDESIKELIRKRADSSQFSSVYRFKK